MREALELAAFVQSELRAHRGCNGGIFATPSFAGKLVRQTAPRLYAAQPRLFPRDVLACDGHHALTLCQLDLEHRNAPLAEGDLGTRTPEFPHPVEPGAVKSFDLRAMFQQPFPPGFERLGTSSPARSIARSSCDSAGM
jgi:hypothetical protein